MFLPPILKDCDVTIYSKGDMKAASALVVSETLLTVFLNDTELATLVCSPGACEELAVGFLLSEGLLHNPSEIKEIVCSNEEGLLWIKTKSAVPQLRNFLRGQTASCCRKGRALLHFVNDACQLEPVKSSCKFTAPHLLFLIGLLEDNSTTFRKTGGVHCAALGNGKELLAMYEDIGRHNAVDKVLGCAFLRQVTLEDKCLLLSGRVSSEILIKAVRRGIPLVLSRSAPTLLAVELADQFNITLVGFARGHSLNIYSHGEKVIS